MEEEDFPGALDRTKKYPYFSLGSLGHKKHWRQLSRITRDSFIKAFLIGLWSYHHLETIKALFNYISGMREMAIGLNS